MRLRDIVKEYLEKNGFDGLVSINASCACLVDDLIPCDGEWIENCEAGYRMDCPGEETCDLGGGCEFHIVPGVAEIDGD